MAEIKDCVGKKIKISRTSITIKDENEKTRGVVRDITNFHDLQENKQTKYYKMLRELGVWGNRNFDGICIVKDDIMYIFRNIKSKFFHKKYGYFSESERQKAEEREALYNAIKAAGIDVVECILL